MESQGSYSSGKVPGQAQMRREWDDMVNPPSDVHIQGQGQATNFLQETGTQVKNMAQGAADVGMGAAQGAVNLARGAANIAQGAADAVKSTIGINNSSDTTGGPNSSSKIFIGISNPRGAGTTTTTTPNLMDSNIDVEGLTYPTNTMGDPNYPANTINMSDSTYPRDTNYTPSNRGI